MKIHFYGLVVLIMIAVASCKKENDGGPTLRELHFNMIDSAYYHRQGNAPPYMTFDSARTALHRIDTFWLDTTADIPFAIYRSDSFKDNSHSGKYEALGPEHSWGTYVYNEPLSKILK